ncbi:hypothetical protein GCM10028814_27500 [Angustibacter aerolatus]
MRADLELRVDGVVSTVQADGRLITVATTQPERVWSALTEAIEQAGYAVGRARGDGGRAGVGRLADLLAESGLRLEVVGPRGRVVLLGDGVRSTAGRLVTGSERVQPGNPVALAVLGARSLDRRATAVTAASGAGLLLAVAVLRRALRR